ncbi:MAG: J domain-containing protein, partial [Dongiaceae bacterium]
RPDEPAFLASGTPALHIVLVRTNADHRPEMATESASADGRNCQHPDCAEPGLYRAPKARDRLQDYYWFCLEHVRAYNSAWDYCAGFGEAEIEAQIRGAACWERPTWRLGSWQSYRVEDMMAEFADAFGVHPGERQKEQRRHQDRSPPVAAEDKALAVLGLTAGATRAEIKACYKRLVKRYHPDANGGDKQAEERLKVINQAYSTLRKRPVAT